MGYFDGAENAKVSKSGAHFTPGLYEGDLVRCTVAETKKGPCFFAEFRITNTSDAVNHPIGAERSWCQKMTDKDIAFPALLKFLAACHALNLDDPAAKKEFDEKLKPNASKLLNASVEQNVYAGIKMRIEAFNKKQKDGVKDFTVHNFTRIA